MKKKENLSVWIFLVVFLIALVAIFKFNSDKQSQTEKNVPMFYYGNTCPHCKDVKEYIKTYKIRDKISLIEKEVYNNRWNAQELAKRAKTCNLPTERIPVPFLFADGKCFIGTTDVVDYLSKKAKVGKDHSASDSSD